MSKVELVLRANGEDIRLMSLEGEVPEIFDAQRFARMLMVYLCAMGVQRTLSLNREVEELEPTPMARRVVDLCRKALS
jgi:hypothetical protein